MSELAFASNALRNTIAPPAAASGIAARIRIASRTLQWSFSRTRDVWYADPRVAMKPREIREIEEATGLKYGQQELRELDALISRADALLVGTDPNLAGALAHALRAVAGALDRARTEKRDATRNTNDIAGE